MSERNRTIQEVKQLLAEVASPQDERLKELQLDTRKGVQAALQQWQKAYRKQEEVREQMQLMLEEERKLQREGFQLLAGIDEVGRGPLAGPVVAAAVILPPKMPVLPINDSKKLSASLREQLAEQIHGFALVGIGVVDNHTIDEINIYEATKLAMRKAVAQLPVQPHALLLDAMTLPVKQKQVSLIKGDARSLSIAAASIVAKVYRDKLMAQYSQTYPGYGFEKNAGYGTKEHLDGLHRHGITSIHRLSFEPVKTLHRGEVPEVCSQQKN